MLSFSKLDKYNRVHHVQYNTRSFIIDLTGDLSLRKNASKQSHMIRNPASYSEDRGFESRPDNWLS
jgi:hypothetical protein